jgi:uncharacterized SAM-binding protein YcdF (DUF218 family)
MNRFARWGLLGVAVWGTWALLLLTLLIAWPALLQTHDRLAYAPAIAVLNGETFSRVEQGLTLHTRYGSGIWLTVDPETGAEADGGTASNKRCLRGTHHLGEDKIRILHHRISTTGEILRTVAFRKTLIELEMIEREMTRQGLDRIIVVTSRYHSRRVRALWELSPSRWFKRAIIQHPRVDDYDDASHIRKEAFLTAIALSIPWSLIMSIREVIRIENDDSLSLPATKLVCKGDGSL